MPSHAILEILSAPLAPYTSTPTIIARLTCGCILDLSIPPDRILIAHPNLPHPSNLHAVGKYPCPIQHPVSRSRDLSRLPPSKDSND